MEAADTSSFLSLFAAISYGIASMAMVFINKAVLMQHAHSMTLLTLQQLATTLLIHFGRSMGCTKAGGLNVDTAKKLIFVSLFYNANVAFALASLKGVNIPMYIAIKRLTPLAVLIAGFFTGKGKPSTQVSLSVMLTAAGVIIAALGDFSFDLLGYSMALTSVFFQTMYLVLVEKSGAEDGLSSIEIMFYNSFLSLPFLLFLIIATGEFPNSVSLLLAKENPLPSLSPQLLWADECWWSCGLMVVLDIVVRMCASGLWGSCEVTGGKGMMGSGNQVGQVKLDTGVAIVHVEMNVVYGSVQCKQEWEEGPMKEFWIWQVWKRCMVIVSTSLSFLVILVLSLVMGIVLNYTMFLCTIVNSALTTTIVGVLKGVGSTTFGFILLGGVQVHALNVTGLVINTVGGVWYSYAKYHLKKSKLPKRMSDVEAHRK